MVVKAAVVVVVIQWVKALWEVVLGNMCNRGDDGSCTMLKMVLRRLKGW